MYETTGKIKVIFDTQTFASGFAKREFVVTTQHDKYPQDLKFEIVKDKCPLLDGFDEGQEVTVNFDVRGNEYNGKYYVSLAAWKIAGTGAQQQGRGAAQRPAPSNHSVPANRPGSAPDEDYGDEDDIPF